MLLSTMAWWWSQRLSLCSLSQALKHEQQQTKTQNEAPHKRGTDLCSFSFPAKCQLKTQFHSAGQKLLLCQMFLQTLTHAQALWETQKKKTSIKTWKRQGELQHWCPFLFGSVQKKGKGAVKRQEDDRIKVSEPEPDKREEKKKWLKSEREENAGGRTLCGGSHCDTLLSTQKKEMEFNFSLSQRVWEKSPTSTPLM